MIMNTLLLYHQRKENIDDNMLWKESAVRQQCFMRGIIGSKLLDVPMFQISSHMSKSIVLPVYGFMMRNGIKLIARNNFYDWKLSVELPQSLPNNYLPTDLFSDEGKTDITHWYCEGFKDRWVFGHYEPENSDCLKFTVEIDDDYKFYTVLYLLNKAFPNKSFTDVDIDAELVESLLIMIYNANGVYEDDPEEPGHPLMRDWEVIWNVKYKLDKICRSEGKDYKEIDEIFHDTKRLSEYIVSHPELKDVFLSEEYMFSEKF